MGNSRRVSWCLLAVAIMAAAWGFSETARAEVSIGINIGPPPIMVAEPPGVVMIPRSQVHFVPDPNIEVFFFNGYWWSPRGDRWYRARAYNGPWGVIERNRVPRAVLYVPRDYRTMYGQDRQVPYGQWKKDRARWDRDNLKAHKQWEKDREKEWKRAEKEHRKSDKHEDRGDDRGGDRGRHGR
ncbi:MAG: hypothetical protein HW377_1789 [Actinobacteria bacterium]|nr:hypothetical protein [Actinomycetota bacterium]